MPREWNELQGRSIYGEERVSTFLDQRKRYLLTGLLSLSPSSLPLLRVCAYVLWV